MSYAKSALAKKATPRKTKKLWDQQEKVTIKSAGLLLQARPKKENPGVFGGLIFVLTAAIAKLLLSFAKYKNEFYDDHAADLKKGHASRIGKAGFRASVHRRSRMLS